MNLPHGKTHYYICGPENGIKVILVHGVTAPAATLSIFPETLAKLGFRVLCYDVYGRGYSASPGATYDKALYLTQLALLADALKWDSFVLMGYSMGGAIDTAFTSVFPKKVDKLVLICPAGLLPELPLLGKIVKVPIVGAFLMHLM